MFWEPRLESGACICQICVVSTWFNMFYFRWWGWWWWTRIKLLPRVRRLSRGFKCLPCRICQIRLEDRCYVLILQMRKLKTKQIITLQRHRARKWQRQDENRGLSLWLSKPIIRHYTLWPPSPLWWTACWFVLDIQEHEESNTGLRPQLRAG